VDRGISGSVLLAAASGAILAAPLVLQWGGRPCWRVLDNRPMRWVGARSYGLYLVHFAVVTEVGEHVLDVTDDPRAFFVLVLCVALPLSLLAAHLSYELVERPFLALKRRRRAPGARPLVARAGGR
jgi:peptidoglycan/LPS O-acetylase OafA/YrhL